MPDWCPRSPPVALLCVFAVWALTACSSSAGSEAEQAPTTQPVAPETAAREPASDVLSELDVQLIDAAWANDVEAARRLIEAGADVNAKDRTEQSAYLIATSEGYTDLLELTLEEGADVRSLDSYRGTGLIRAAERGHARVVGRLLQTGIDIDHVNRLGWTALHEAIILGEGTERYVDTVRLLVAEGADLELAPARDGIVPIEHARMREQTRVVETLTRGMTPPPPDPDAALLAAAAAGDADAAAHAIRAGAALEARDAQGRTPLLLAAAEERVDVARLLVALGANPDAQDGRQDTPWLVTGVTGSVAMLETLLPANPDMTIVNRFGGTSLIPASERGHVDYVRRVVETGVDVNHVNDLEWTALLEAVILGDGTVAYQEIVGILLEAGADPAIADADGVTALEHARAAGYDEIAGLLAAR